MDVVVTSKKTARFIKNHKNELIVGGIVIVGGAIFGARLYKAGFVKGVAATKFANGADCSLHVTPKLWINQDGSSILTASLTQVGPTISGGMAENTIALPKAEAMEVVGKMMEIFKEA